MSEEIPLAAADRAAQLAAIRARWAGVEWTYEAGRDGDYVHSAMLSVGDDGDGAILLDEPSAQEQATLHLAAQAPADIARLLAELATTKADSAALRQAILDLMPYAPAGTPQDLPPMVYAAVRAVDQALESGTGAALLAEIEALRAVVATLRAIERVVNERISGVRRVPIEEWTALLGQAQAVLVAAPGETQDVASPRP